MTVSQEARELATKSMYEARTQGAYVTPWEAMPSDRRWFWYEAFDAALPIILADLEGRTFVGERITVLPVRKGGDADKTA